MASSGDGRLELPPFPGDFLKMAALFRIVEERVEQLSTP